MAKRAHPCSNFKHAILHWSFGSNTDYAPPVVNTAAQCSSPFLFPPPAVAARTTRTKYFRTWPERVKILVAPFCPCFSVSLKAIKVSSQTCKICQKTLRQKLGEFRGFDQKPLDIWTLATGRRIGPILSSAWVLQKGTEEFQSYKMGGGMLSDRWDFSRSIKWATTKSKDYIALEVFIHI